MTEDEARARARQGLRDLWPGWDADLVPLGGLSFRAPDTPLPAVVKVWPIAEAAKARRQVARQRSASEALKTDPFRAPPVLHFAQSALCLVMQDCGAPTLEAALAQSGPDHAADLVRRAGGWIAVYHALSLRQAPFRPAGHLQWLDKLARMGENGGRDIPDLPRFRDHIAGMHAAFDAVKRLPTIRAVTHKDMTARNLLIDEALVWGIDFENDASDEPLRDLFALGVDICAFSPFGQDRMQALSALRNGYGENRGDPRVRLFLQRAFALGLWARTPTEASIRQKARLQIAHWVLEQAEPVL